MFFGGNENTLVLSPLATFSRSGSTAFACCRYSCHFLDPVSFFFHSLLHNSCTIPRLLFPSSYTLPDLPWKETTRGKLASPKARLIQAPGNEIGLSLSPPFYGPLPKSMLRTILSISAHQLYNIESTWLFTQVLVKDVSTIACVNVYHTYFVFIFTRIVISLYPKTRDKGKSE